MPALIDRTGQRFGRWAVLARHPQELRCDSRHILWECRCDCGAERVVRGGDLRSGHSTSCGCRSRELFVERNTKHGHARRGNLTQAYHCWVSMHQRCDNPRNRNYANYGGRGITVCERWKTFVNFLADMGEPPPGMSLDRVDNNGNYEKSNCRWTTRIQQNRNQRRGKRKHRRAELADILAYADALARAAGRTRRETAND
jgi:hypothetical protein